jgi:hypothetical protein
MTSNILTVKNTTQAAPPLDAVIQTGPTDHFSRAMIAMSSSVRGRVDPTFRNHLQKWL